MQKLPVFQIGYNNFKLKPRNILFGPANRRHAQSKPLVLCSTAVAHANAKAVSKVLTNQVPNMSSSSLTNSACSVRHVRERLRKSLLGKLTNKAPNKLLVVNCCSECNKTKTVSAELYPPHCSRRHYLCTCFA